MFDKLLKNNIILTFLIGGIVFGIIYYSSLVLITIDKNLSDKMYSTFVSNDLKVSNEIVIVKIDSKTLAKDGLGRFPFSRKYYIDLIKNLNNDGAQVIGFDVIFADKTTSEIDLQFSNALKEADNIIIGGGTIGGILEQPLDIFEKAVLSYGYFTPKQNKDNNKIYSVETHKTLNNGTFEHFAISILKAYFSKNYEDKSIVSFFKQDTSNFYITPTRKVPYSNFQTKEININYASDSKFYWQSFIDVYNGNFPKGFFNDKIVIIGATADGIKDVFFTPEGIKFGVYTHANLINTILTKQYKIYFEKHLEYTLIFLLILLSVYFNISKNGNQLLLSNIVIISVFGVILWLINEGMNNALNFPAQFLFALIITLTASNIMKSFMEDKNKTKLNKALSQYVSKDIADEILHGSGRVNLDGERKKISIFFSDIEGFTTISEKMDPEELVHFLREYLGKMSDIIMDEGGLIDKYEGDAIMALWGVFGHEYTSTYDNCIAAIKQKKALITLNSLWKQRFGEELKIRMGLHTGEAIIGNIGSEGRKMEYTALGDNVNLASRLEEVNKQYGTYICASEVVYAEQKENFTFRYLDKIRVKGKTIPISIYELISYVSEKNEEQGKIIADFESATTLYLERKFKEAKVIFQRLANKGDTPSMVYVDRCNMYIEKMPAEPWDGVWIMTTK